LIQIHNSDVTRAILFGSNIHRIVQHLGAHWGSSQRSPYLLPPRGKEGKGRGWEGRAMEGRGRKGREGRLPPHKFESGYIVVVD